jgi:hypothetical protein
LLSYLGELSFWRRKNNSVLHLVILTVCVVYLCRISVSLRQWNCWDDTNWNWLAD